jgi:hypothetical protein
MRSKRGFSLLILFVLLLMMVPPASALIGTPVNSRWAWSHKPTIDGVISGNEWVNATVVNFTFDMRYRGTGKSFANYSAKFYVLNDYTNLYAALQIFNAPFHNQNTSANLFDEFSLLFEDHKLGNLTAGDNGEGVVTCPDDSRYHNNDWYFDGTNWVTDVSAGKTNDGALNFSHTNPIQDHLGNYTFETRIPLVGKDGPNYDFNITTLPKTLGFKIVFSDFVNGADGVYPDDPTISKNYQEIKNGTTYGSLTLNPPYTLTITATPPSGGTTTPAPGPHLYSWGDVATVSATPYSGYVFDHWELDGAPVGSSSTYSLTMYANHTLNAVFTRIQYTLTITTTAGGTTSPLPGPHTYYWGDVANVTATPYGGYLFDHWELDTVKVGSANPYSLTMYANHTLNAVFTRIQCTLTITATPPSGGTTTPAPGKYTYYWGDVATVSATPYSGYVFDHWELDGAPVGSSSTYSLTMYANHILQAVFRAYIPPVGGMAAPIVIPTNKPNLLISLIWLAPTIISIALTVSFVKLKKKKL